jgi:hypothetical protein
MESQEFGPSSSPYSLTFVCSHNTRRPILYNASKNNHTLRKKKNTRHRPPYGHTLAVANGMCLLLEVQLNVETLAQAHLGHRRCRLR